MPEATEILILDDDRERIARFVATTQRLQLGEPQVWRSATQMVRELDGWLPRAKLISLDHDLELAWDEGDPGDGLLAAIELGRRTPSCPVIVHTSNTERGIWMMGELQLGGWSAHRVLPLGEDWIETDWAAVCVDLIKRRSC